MHYGVDRLLSQQTLDGPSIADVASNEPQLRALLDRLETGEIAGVGQRIEHYHTLAGVGIQPIMDEVGANEAGAAGDEQPMHWESLSVRRAGACANERERDHGVPASVCPTRCRGAGGPASGTPRW